MTYENGVFEGGGAKIPAYVGVFKALEAKGICLKRVAGASAGAIFSGAYAVGYTSEELEGIILDTDFTKFQDDSRGYLRDGYRLYEKFGLYKGDYFYNWYGELLKSKCDNADITFKEVKDVYGIELVIVGSCLNKMQAHYYHAGSNPDMAVRDAVRISMSIPVPYVPVLWGPNGSHTRPRKRILRRVLNRVFKRSEEENDEYDTLVDGGLIDNYPIWIFDKETLDSSKEVVIGHDSSIPVNEKTIGFKLVGSKDKRDNIIYHTNNPIKNFPDFLSALVDTMMAQNERLYIKKGYWEQTVTINCGNVKAMDFDLSKETKEKLIDTGYIETLSFLNK